MFLFSFYAEFSVSDFDIRNKVLSLRFLQIEIRCLTPKTNPRLTIYFISSSLGSTILLCNICENRTLIPGMKNGKKCKQIMIFIMSKKLFNYLILLLQREPYLTTATSLAKPLVPDNLLAWYDNHHKNL